MSHIRAVYELRRFTRASDPDFQAALQLYIRLIPGPVRTYSNEIAHWIECYSDFAPDQFCVLGLYHDTSIIGYAQFAYFHRERIIAFDYLLLHEQHRTQGRYFQFIELLKRWVDDQNWEVDYVVAEVAIDLAPHEPNKQPPLIELFKQAGFAVADCPYYQPQLGLDNEQSDIQAYFLVRSGEGMPSIAATVFIKLVETVYFRHYQRWYQPFLEERKRYEQVLIKRFSEIKAATANRERIELDGVKETVTTEPSPPPPRRSRKSRQYVSSVCVAMLVLAMCFCLLLFQRIFDRDASVVLGYLAASLVVSMAAFALFYQKGQRVLVEVLRFLKSYGKKRSR